MNAVNGAAQKDGSPAYKSRPAIIADRARFYRIADATLIAGAILVWLSALSWGRSVFLLRNVPDRIILCFPWHILACFGVGALILAANIRIALSQRREVSISILSSIRFRLSWLVLLVMVCLLLFPFSPGLTANGLFFGVPAIMALALMGVYRAPRAGNSCLRDQWCDWAAILLLFTLIYGSVGLYFTNSVGEHSGDEGHYLIQANSLYADHDLDLRNNFGNPDRIEPGRVHISGNSRAGRWYSWHTPGLSFLLAPTVPGGLPLRHLVLGFISGLGLAGMYWLARMIGAERRSAWISVLLLGGGAFWGVYSSRALPEVLGAMLATYGLIFCLAQRQMAWTATGLVILIAGLLPWAHARFIPVAGALIGCFGLNGLLGPERLTRKILRLSLFTAGCAIVLGAYQLAQLRMFIDGLAYPVPRLLFSYPLGLWHTLSSNRGVLYVFPAFACGLAACFFMIVKRGTRAVGIYAIIFFLSVWLTSCATAWFTGGSCLSGRFLVVISPILMACLARVLSDSNAGFRALALYLGLMPVALFATELLVLKRLGNSFADPYLVELVHPLFTNLARFVYAPDGAVNLLPAGLLYAVVMVLVFWRHMPRVAQWSAIVVLIAGLVFQGRRMDDGVRSHCNPLQSEFSLDRNVFSRMCFIVMGDTQRAQPLLKYFDMFSNAGTNETTRFTTRDLGALEKDGWISIPHISVNDWDGRNYRWATLVPPFRTGKGLRALFLDARLSGSSAMEFLIREGANTLIVKQYPAGSAIRETFSFKTGDSGDLYVLARFIGTEAEGSLVCNRIACSGYSQDLLLKANLFLANPDK